MSHVLGIGLDILSVSRVERLLENKRYHDKFLRRILSQPELELFQRFSMTQHKHDPALFLASRFCAKEAAYKSLYPFAKLTWKDLALSKLDDKPALALESLEMREKLREICQFDSFLVSLSHDAGLVAAVVLATRKRSVST